MTSHPELRPVGLEDAGWVAELRTRCRPAEPDDPEVLRHRWATFQLAWFHDRSAVMVGGEAVGVATAWHAPWEAEPERVGRWNLRLVPEVTGLADDVIPQVEARLRAEGARTLSSGAYEDEAWLQGALSRRRYRRDHVERAWELDLVTHRDRLLKVTAECRARMAEQGLRMVTLDGVADQPDFWARLTTFYAETTDDEPHTTPVHAMSEAEVRAELTGPDIRGDRVWLAFGGQEIAGLSYLTYPPVRGHSWTGFTATGRAFRGQGIARAVKMESLAQAIELGVRTARTDNDERNAPMLRINDSLGYAAIPSWVAYLKDVS
jgi:RimJ/RimL family protein N-acetyltransferase